MRKFQVPAVHNAHPNVTPLIDVVMCLIIFFMLVAKIGVSTGAERMTIPETIWGQDIKDMGNTLTLNVRAPESGGEEPTITALVRGQMEPLRVRDAQGRKQLAETLKYFRYGATLKPGDSHGDNPNFSVIIRGEESLAYRYLEPVLMAAVEANVTKVSFNTRKVTVAARP